jgi:hypothetical protein
MLRGYGSAERYSLTGQTGAPPPGSAGSIPVGEAALDPEQVARLTGERQSERAVNAQLRYDGPSQRFQADRDGLIHRRRIRGEVRPAS